jgi:methylamine---glutamate N-methyltransferase subunit A
MCGIIGLHLRDPELQDQLGSLMTTMLQGIIVRGPDSAGVALYGDTTRVPEGHAAVSVLHARDDLAEAVAARLPDVQGLRVELAGETTVITAATDPGQLAKAVEAAMPEAMIIGQGDDSVVYKGVGHPLKLAEDFRLAEATGWQGVAHTRMATESAINAEGSHPYAAGTGLSLVHNGSFSNYASIRRELEFEGATFDSHNDTEVAARFVSARLDAGDDLEAALVALAERFDGFFTLLVTTNKGFAVARDEIACKPAIIAEHPRWVAMASEFQALAHLPGINEAHVFEPEPGKVYAWKREGVMTGADR